MKKKSLRQRIKDYLDIKGDWICSGSIQDLASQAGYEPSNASRRLRELCQDFEIEVQYRKGQQGQKVAWYKSTSPKTPVTYFVPELNKEIAIYK